MAIARIVRETALYMVFDPAARLRLGDASAWPRYSPEHLPTEEVWDAWTAGVRRRGQPGAPATIRVYTHFAYCESTCNFCMYFHQVPRDPQAYARYVDYLVGSIERFEQRAGRVQVSAAYAGGGTPSATPAPELARYLNAFRRAFEVSGEFSFEAHPRVMDLEKLELLHAHGVNRISMGVQSLEPSVLREITRKNAPLESLAQLVLAAQSNGIVVNLDLVLGLSG
jgi:oxygen-independent coproporphyrinogen-3 oxidase